MTKKNAAGACPCCCPIEFEAGPLTPPDPLFPEVVETSSYASDEPKTHKHRIDDVFQQSFSETYQVDLVLSPSGTIVYTVTYSWEEEVLPGGGGWYLRLVSNGTAGKWVHAETTVVDQPSVTWTDWPPGTEWFVHLRIQDNVVELGSAQLGGTVESSFLVYEWYPYTLSPAFITDWFLRLTSSFSPNGSTDFLFQNLLETGCPSTCPLSGEDETHIEWRFTAHTVGPLVLPPPEEIRHTGCGVLVTSEQVRGEQATFKWGQYNGSAFYSRGDIFRIDDVDFGTTNIKWDGTTPSTVSQELPYVNSGGSTVTACMPLTFHGPTQEGWIKRVSGNAMTLPGVPDYACTGGSPTYPPVMYHVWTQAADVVQRAAASETKFVNGTVGDFSSSFTPKCFYIANIATVEASPTEVQVQVSIQYTAYRVVITGQAGGPNNWTMDNVAYTSLLWADFTDTNYVDALPPGLSIPPSELPDTIYDPQADDTFNLREFVSWEFFDAGTPGVLCDRQRMTEPLTEITGYWHDSVSYVQHPATPAYALGDTRTCGANATPNGTNAITILGPQYDGLVPKAGENLTLSGVMREGRWYPPGLSIEFNYSWRKTILKTALASVGFTGTERDGTGNGDSVRVTTSITGSFAASGGSAVDLAWTDADILADDITFTLES